MNESFVEIKGDYWNHIRNGYDAICFTSNRSLDTHCNLIMGAGIAKQFKDKFPHLPAEFGARALTDGSFNGLMVSDSVSDFYIVAFPTKNHWKENSDLTLIKNSFNILTMLLCTMGWKKVLMTRPGCGLGKLDWEKDVKPLVPTDKRIHIIHNETA